MIAMLQHHLTWWVSLGHPSGLCVCDILETEELTSCHVWARMNHEACLTVKSQKLDSKGLRMAKDGNLVKVFWWEESKMATSMFEILDGFSSVWFPTYQQSKSTILLVTSNFELEQIDICNKHSQSDFAHSFDFHCLTDFAQGINLCGRLLFDVCYYVKVQFSPWRVIDISHYGEQNLSWNVY